jgi:O-methyltransferase involved in polyketide biosynthesis
VTPVPAEKVDFTGVRETLLATLYGRAVDARSADPILGDRYAGPLVDKIAYDFARTRITAGTAGSVALRAGLLDGWARGFLARHRDAVVLHLGCGLDTRALRLAPGPDVNWYDIDYPDVIEMRRRLAGGADGRPGDPGDRAGYTMIGSSVTEPAWLDRMPADRPALVVAEGLLYYLREEEAHDLLRRITERFPSGELMFDMVSRLGLKLQSLNKPLKASGASMSWAFDRPEELSEAVPRLRCVETLRSTELPGSDRLPALFRWANRVVGQVPKLREAGMFYRYEF